MPGSTQRQGLWKDWTQLTGGVDCTPEDSNQGSGRQVEEAGVHISAVLSAPGLLVFDALLPSRNVK